MKKKYSLVDTIGFSQSILTVRENDGVVQITIFSYVFSYISPQNLTLNLTTYDIGAMEGSKTLFYA